MYDKLLLIQIKDEIKSRLHQNLGKTHYYTIVRLQLKIISPKLTQYIPKCKPSSTFPDHTFLAIVTLNSRLAKLSVLLRLNTPSSPLAPENGHRIPDDQRSSSSEPDLYCALPTMRAGKCSMGCAELDGALLVCGGYDRVECLRTCEKYVPETNTWEVLAPMREARGRFSIAVVRGKVYAIGGSNGSTELATVEVLDPGSPKWKAVASLPLARSNSGVCALGDKIYCIGGWNGQVGLSLI